MAENIIYGANLGTDSANKWAEQLNIMIFLLTDC